MKGRRTFMPGIRNAVEIPGRGYRSPITYKHKVQTSIDSIEPHVWTPRVRLPRPAAAEGGAGQPIAPSGGRGWAASIGHARRWIGPALHTGARSLERIRPWEPTWKVEGTRPGRGGGVREAPLDVSVEETRVRAKDASPRETCGVGTILVPPGLDMAGRCDSGAVAPPPDVTLPRNNLEIRPCSQRSQEGGPSVGTEAWADACCTRQAAWRSHLILAPSGARPYAEIGPVPFPRRHRQSPDALLEWN